MANVLIEEQNLTDIANAIRNKNGGDVTYKPSEMAAAINNIQINNSFLKEENLFNINEITPNKYIGNGTEIVYNSWSITNYIPLEFGKYYSMAPLGLIGADLQYSGFYNENKEYIRRVVESDFTSNKVSLLSVPENVRYVRFSSESNDIYACEVYEFKS